MTTLSNITVTKFCKRCEIEKQITEFYSNSRGGYLPRCKSCHCIWLRERGETKIKPVSKKCNKCGELKPFDQFYKTVDGRLFGFCKACEAVKRAANSEKHAARARQWRQKNPERVFLSSQASRRRRLLSDPSYERRQHQKHKEKRNKQKKLYCAANRNKIRLLQKAYRQTNLEKIKVYLSAYWKANPDKAKEYHNRRRARKRNADGSFTADDLARIRKAQRDRCAACRKLLKGKGHADHIIALAKGGSNWPSNIQLLCPSCNGKKRAKDPITFMQEMGYLL